MKIKYLHVAMYRAMDFIYDGLKNPPEALIQFLSDSNPYIWKNRMTADPAVQADFNKSMKKQNIDSEVDEEIAYLAVKNFLAEKSPEYNKLFGNKKFLNFAELFEKISLDEWKKLCEIVSAEEE